MAAPAIRVVNPNALPSRQQAVLVATKEARMYKEKKMIFPKPPGQLLHQSTALVCAKELLRAEGIPAPSHQQCLGKLVIPFGQYEHAPFGWLVANDVGYMKYVIDKDREEAANPHRTAAIQNHWIKDCLAEYAEGFPQVSIVLEANIDRCIYGQKGFEDHSFREMWELYRQHSRQKDRPECFGSDQRELIRKAYSSELSSSSQDPTWLDDSAFSAVMDLGEEPGRSKKPEPEASSCQASSSARSSSTSQLPVTKVRSPTKASSTKATCSSQPLSSVQASSSTQQSYPSRAPAYTSSPFKEPLPSTSVKMKSSLSTGGSSSVESPQGESPVSNSHTYANRWCITM